MPPDHRQPNHTTPDHDTVSHDTLSFEKTNGTIVKAGNEAGDMMGELHVYINSRRQHYLLPAQQADTLCNITVAVCVFIDSVRRVLQSADTAGTGEHVAEKLLIGTATGKRLTGIISGAYAYIRYYWAHYGDRELLDSIWKSAGVVQADDHWLKRFEGMPTVGAITVLNLFKSECTLATVEVLNEIFDHVKPH